MKLWMSVLAVVLFVSSARADEEPCSELGHAQTRAWRAVKSTVEQMEVDRLHSVWAATREHRQWMLAADMYQKAQAAGLDANHTAALRAIVAKTQAAAEALGAHTAYLEAVKLRDGTPEFELYGALSEAKNACDKAAVQS